MLAVFQEVAKTIKDTQVGCLASFDLMYDGIAPSFRGDMQTTIKMAEARLGDGLPIRILKSLFLLKWVREFKATPRNVSILLMRLATVVMGGVASSTLLTLLVLPVLYAVFGSGRRADA